LEGVVEQKNKRTNLGCKIKTIKKLNNNNTLLNKPNDEFGKTLKKLMMSITNLIMINLIKNKKK